jgi:hypothetical protein
VVEAVAAALASRIADPIPLKSVDAAAKASGAAITYDDIWCPWSGTSLRPSFIHPCHGKRMATAVRSSSAMGIVARIGVGRAQ